MIKNKSLFNNKYQIIYKKNTIFCKKYFNMGYISKNRHKFYLKYHLIFVCKYRKQLLLSDIRERVLSVFKEIENRCDFDIEIMETDKDHIHLLINYPPNITVTSIVRVLKQVSTNRLWKEFKPILRKYFWKEYRFWSDGYIVCFIGEANSDTIRKYIENQG